ncbi:MAG TPA: hypothetical protein DFK19_12605 [Ochrobactrum sp.]|nr:hypothetical protein [Ochrobactrum sp.]
MAVLVFQAGAANAATVLDNTFPKDAPISFEEMHQIVSKDFTDPNSTQYKGLSIHDQPGRGAAICGWVNAKNAFGGYTPFYPFGFLVEKRQADINRDFQDPILFDLREMSFAMYGCKEALGYSKPQ